MVRAQTIHTQNSRAAIWQGPPHYGQLSPHEQEVLLNITEHEAPRGSNLHRRHAKPSQNVTKELLHSLHVILLPYMTAYELL